MSKWNSHPKTVQESLATAINVIPEIPGLYIGNLLAATDLELLQKHRITHIVQILEEDWQPFRQSEIEYLWVNIEDCEEARDKLGEWLPRIYSFVDKGLLSGGQVLVHCQMGSSRSGAVTVALLMRHCRIGYTEGLALAQKARPCIAPNKGFESLLLTERRKEGRMDSRDKTTDSIVVTIEIDELSRSSDLATEYFGGGGDGTGELLVRRFLQLVGASLYAFEDEYPPVQTLKVVVAAFDGVADTSGTKTDKTLRLSASYFTHARHTDLDHELHGVIVHELVHVLQYDGSIDAGATANGGFIEGLADYVRITAGLAPGHWRPESQPPASNDKWDRGYEHTAYFLRWVDRNSPSNTASNTSSTGNVSNTAATFKLNLLLRDLVWDDALFEIVAGAPVNQLWRGYLASFIDAETKAADANVLANDHAVFTADLRSLLSIAESQKDPLFLGRMRASIARPLREYLLLFNSDDEIVRRGYEK